MFNLIQLRDCLQKEDRHKQNQNYQQTIEQPKIKEMDEVRDQVSAIPDSARSIERPRLGRRLTIEEERSGDYRLA